MRSFVKKCTVILMSAALLVPTLNYVPCLADGGDISAETAAARVFTIDDAIAYAKENSSSIAAAKANEAYAKSSSSEARITRSKLRDNRMMTVTDVSTVLVTSGYAYEAALANYRIAQRSVIQAEYTLESNVSSAFYTYLSNVEKVKIAQSALDSAKERTAAANIRHDNGFISDNDLENFNIAELQAQNSLESAKRAKEASILSLKSIINYPLDQDLTLTGSFTRRPKDTTSYSEAIEKAANGISRANTEETLKIAAGKKKIYQGFYTSNQPAWHSAEAEYAAAELNYNNAINSERMNLFNAWSAVQSVYDGLELYDRTLALKEKQVEASKISFNMGTISADTYLDAIKDLDAAKNNVLDTELQAYMANEQYRLLFDCTNTIFEEGN